MNTWVICFLIFSATAIAIVAIICDYFIENKMKDIDRNNKNLSECYESKKITKIHRNYIVGFLAFGIITIITAKTGTCSELFAYLSFGSTITSLVLSILAIFITVQSNSDLYSQFTRMDNATAIMKDISHQIENNINKMSESEKKINDASDGLSLQMDKLVNHIDEKIRVRMAETQEKIAEQIIKTQKEQRVGDSTSNLGSDSISLDDLKKNYLSFASAIGVLLLYICRLSADSKREFYFSKLLKDSEQYSYGFLISTTSIGLVDATIVDGDRVICENIRFDKTELCESLKEKAKKLDSFFLKQINEANEHFGEKAWEIEIQTNE